MFIGFFIGASKIGLTAGTCWFLLTSGLNQQKLKAHVILMQCIQQGKILVGAQKSPTSTQCK